MKKNKWINVVLTSVMLLNAVLSPQLIYSVSASLSNNDADETSQVDTDEKNDDEVLENDKKDDGIGGDNDVKDERVVDDKGEEKTEEEVVPEEKEEVTVKTPKVININDPPADDKTNDAIENEEEAEETTDNVQSNATTEDADNTARAELTDDEIIFSNIKFTDRDGNEFSSENLYDLEAAETGRLYLDWALPKGHRVKGGDTYSFNLPVEFTPTEATNGTLGDVGTWTVNTAGLVTFTFNDNVDGDEVAGNFWFKIRLVEEKLENTIEQEIAFPVGPEEYTINFSIRPKGGSLIDKAGTINNNGFNASEAYWTIDINTGLETLINPSVTDAIPTNMELQAGSVEVYELGVDIYGNRIQGTELAPSKYSVTTDPEGNPVITFNDLSDEEAKQAYQITYTTDIVEPEAGFDGTQTFKNRARLINNGESSEATSTVSSGYGKAIEKNDPNYNSKDQTFDWAINYNYNQKYIDAGQAMISDTWDPVGAMELENLTVHPVTIASDGTASVSSEPIANNLYRLTKKADNSGFDLQFMNNIEGQAYQIRYNTKLLGEQNTGVVTEDGTVTNKVTTGTGKTDGSKGTWGQQGIIKSHSETDVDAKEIDWSILLNQNSYQMDNLVLEDTFSGDGLTLIEESVKITRANGNEFTAYNLDYTPPTDGNPGGFTITFTEESINEPLTLTYTTHFERNSDETATYGNTAGINWSEGGRTYSTDTGKIDTTPEGHTAANGVKTGRYNAEDKQITWEVNTNYARLPIVKPYTITDAIPANQEFVANSLEVYSYTVTPNGEIINQTPLAEGSYIVDFPEENKGELVVTLGDALAGERTAIGIRFKTEFTNDWVQDAKVENTAVVNNGSDEFELGASVEIPYGGEYAKKYGSQTGEFNERVDWTLELNPNQTRISNYKLTDNPDLNSILIEDSFVVYEANVNASGDISATDTELVEGEDYTLEITTNNETGYQQFILEFLNEIDQAYVLEYSSHIDPMAPQGEEISNSYVVEGENIEKITTTQESYSVTKVNDSGGDGSSIRGGLTISKEDEAGNPLAGATFELYTSDGAQLLRTGTTDAQGNLRLGGLRRGTYLLKEVAAPNRYVISDELAEGVEITLDHDSDGEFSPFEYTNHLTKVKINKVDVNGAPINESAVFNIYDSSDDSLVEQNVATTNGTIIVEDLDPGDYYLVEQQAPAGYIRNTQKIPFTIAINENGTQTVPNVDVVNYQGSAEFVKIDESGNPLAGAIFRVETTNGNVVASGLTSNDEGIVRIDGLAPGNYRLIEMDAPEGYISNTEEIAFNIPNAVQGEPEVFSIADYTNYQGKVCLHKTDDAGHPLAGATFEIRDANNEAVRKNLVTGEDGRLLVFDLAPGDYTFVEVSAPEGYMIDKTPKPFTIDASAEGEPAVVSAGNAINYQGSVVLEKTNVDGNALAGAAFTLYEELEDETRVPLGTYTSNSKGLVEVENLAPGNYVFVETRAPAGFLINEQEIEFTIATETAGRPKRIEAGQAVNYQGSVELTKTDVNGAPLAGAVFDIVDENGKTVKTGLTSDDNGWVTADELAPGNYRFVETQAPKGYILNETHIPFEISETALGVPAVVETTAVNYQGSVEWTKIDENDAALSDATFNILDANGDVVAKNLESDAEGRFSYDGLAPGNYTIVETSAAEGYLLNTEAMAFTVPESAEADVNIELDNFVNYQGSVQLQKLNEDGDVLQGASFEVHDANKNVIREVISDENGRVFVDGLAPGDYTFVEIASPDGYITNTQPVEFTIPSKAAGEPEVVTADNFINYQGTVELEKIDVNGEPLAGAVFEIRDLDNHLIQKNLISNKDGIVTAENLAPGTYNFHEIVAPTGYVLNEQSIEFTIEPSAAGQPVRVQASTAVNYQGSVELEKTDMDGNPLAGAIFEVRDANDEFVREVSSNEDGLVFVDELAPGDYKFVETQAPSGYLINETEVPFTILDTALGEPAVIDAGQMVNYQGSVEWSKVDEGGIPLPGAQFNVVDEAGTVVAENVVANDDGLVEVDGLAPGTYTIIETDTVSDYILNTEQSQFEISESATGVPGTVVAADFVNYQGKVQLSKTDDSGNPLGGAVFTLALDGEIIEEELITDAKGQITLDGLVPGNYTFTEVEAPAGYIVDTTPIDFSVAAENEGEPVLITVGDVVNYQGEVALTKVDVNGNPLAGAVFELRDANDNRLKDNITTGQNGLLTISHLAPGDYVLREIIAPTGYVLNTTPIHFTIKETSEGKPELLSLGEFINYQGSVELLKTDEGGNPLADAEFSVLDAAGNEIREGLVTNADGKLVIEDLAPGQYTLVETKAPAGYALSDEVHSFEILAEAEGEPAQILLTVTNALEPEEPIEPTEGSNLPQTGEAQTYTLLAVLLIIIGIGLGFYNKKRTD